MRVLHGALLALLVASPASAADATRGKELFTACLACHGEGPDALGPSLKGVVGRKAGSRDDYRYSGAMTRSSIVWDANSLRDYLHDPQAIVRGNRMPFSGFTDTRDAEDVVAYLMTYK